MSKNRSTRQRLSLVCPGCDRAFSSSRSYSYHMLDSEFCLAIEQWGVDTNPPASEQHFTPGVSESLSNFQSQAPIPFSTVRDNYNVELDNPEPPSLETQGDPDLPEGVNLEHLPAPPVLDPHVIIERALTGEQFSNVYKACIKLLHKLLIAGCPLYLYDDIIKWAEDATLDKVAFDSNIPSRKKILNDLEKQFKTAPMKPQSLPYQLEGHGTEHIPIFNFKAMVASLLHDERLMQSENLVIKEDDPASFQDRYNLDSNNLDEIHTGTVCRESIQETCIGPKDVFLGIILYIDGTVLGNFTNAKLEPVMFSLTIFNRATRNKAYAWRPLGYIKRPTDNIVGDNETAIDLKGRNNRNFHRALRLILKGIIDVQKDGGMTCDMIIGDHFHKDFNLKVKICCLIGDCQGADDACSRYASHSASVQSLCRDCHCLTKDADRTDLDCIYRTRQDFVNASDEDLRLMSHHRCKNTFDVTEMCDAVGGISQSCPPESLHWKNLGLDKTAVVELNENVLGNGNNANSFDNVLGAVSRQCQHQSDRDMPLVTFPKGFSAMTKKSIKAAEYAGLMLAYVIAWETHGVKHATYNVLVQQNMKK